MSRHSGDTAPASLPRADKKAFEQNAVAQLCTWLVLGETESADPFVDQLVRNASWVTFLMVVSPLDVQFAALEAELERLWAMLPVWMQERPARVAPALSRPEIQPAVSFWWPSSLATGKLKEALTPGLLLIEDKVDVEDQVQHERWRQWLRLFNTLQVLPGFILATREGLEAGDYEHLGSAAGVGTRGELPVLAEDGAWMSVLEQAMEAVRPGLEALSNAGISPPDEIGYERVDERGAVDAEAELAWLVPKIVVLLDSQAEYQKPWEDGGWRVVIAADGWEQSVLSLLVQQESEAI
jgi:DEAD/DEAH box helicase domain-containing protein